MTFPTNPIYKLMTNMDGEIRQVKRMSPENTHIMFIPFDKNNTDYQQYLQDIKDNGMSIVEVNDCGDGAPNDSMWQYIDNAEELLVNKYGSDQDK